MIRNRLYISIKSTVFRCISDIDICIPEDCILRFCVYSSTRRPKNAYISQYTRPLFVEIIACRLLGAKPSSEPILDYCQLDTWEHIWKWQSAKWHLLCLGLNVLNFLLSTETTAYSWWRHQMETFRRCWPLLRGIHRWPVNSSHKSQWREALMFSLICAWINSSVNNRETGDLRRHRAHYDVTVMIVVSVFSMYILLYIRHQVELLFLLIESPSNLKTMLHISFWSNYIFPNASWSGY